MNHVTKSLFIVTIGAMSLWYASTSLTPVIGQQIIENGINEYDRGENLTSAPVNLVPESSGDQALGNQPNEQRNSRDGSQTKRPRLSLLEAIVTQIVRLFLNL